MTFLSVEALKMFSLLLKRLLVHSGAAGLYSQLLGKLGRRFNLACISNFLRSFGNVGCIPSMYGPWVQFPKPCKKEKDKFHEFCCRPPFSLVMRSKVKVNPSPRGLLLAPPVELSFCAFVSPHSEAVAS